MVTRRDDVARNAVFWADLGPPAGRRPVVVVSRDAAARVLTTVMVAPVTRTIRGIRSEVQLGPENGLPEVCVANCDHVLSVPVDRLDPQPVGTLDLTQRVTLDRALRYSLDILA